MNGDKTERHLQEAAKLAGSEPLASIQSNVKLVNTHTFAGSLHTVSCSQQFCCAAPGSGQGMAVSAADSAIHPCLGVFIHGR